MTNARNKSLNVMSKPLPAMIVNRAWSMRILIGLRFTMVPARPSKLMGKNAPLANIPNRSIMLTKSGKLVRNKKNGANKRPVIMPMKAITANKKNPKIKLL